MKERIPSRDKEFDEFANKIEREVNDVGTQKNSTTRSAQAVTQRLYELTKGDSTQVTREIIEREFDVVDSLSGKQED